VLDVTRAPDEPPVASGALRGPDSPARPRRNAVYGEGGEWQELVDLLLASLTMTQAPVTAAERDELRSLAEAMELPADQLARLNVHDR